MSDTEPDPDSGPGAHVTLPRLPPLLGLLAAGSRDSTELATGSDSCECWLMPAAFTALTLNTSLASRDDSQDTTTEVSVFRLKGSSGNHALC
ncbi:hypothetical protein CRUP_020060 [Coryphaenoides rupestris]|nr:hypothetical protein CRUP_020060 [Coryphaenoides rupestris]